MASQLRVQAAFTKMIPLKHPYMATFLEYQADFGGANKVLVALSEQEGRHLRQGVHGDRCARSPRRSSTSRASSAARVTSLFTSNVRYNEVVEDGFRGGNIVSADFTGTPQQLAKVRENLMKSDWVGPHRLERPDVGDGRRDADGERPGNRRAARPAGGGRAARGDPRQVRERQDRRPHHRLRQGGRRHRQGRGRRARVLRHRVRHHGAAAVLVFRAR